MAVRNLVDTQEKRYIKLGWFYREIEYIKLDHGNPRNTGDDVVTHDQLSE